MPVKEIYDRIAQRCKELGYTPAGLCVAMGMRKSFLSDLNRGIKNDMMLSTAVNFAKFLGLSLDYLALGKPEQLKESFSDSEMKLIHAWRQASDSERENVAFILRNYNVDADVQKEAENAV